MTDYPSTVDATDTLGLSRRTSPAVALDDVFDDPEHGEPGKDRMAVHYIWEFALLLAVGAVGYLLWRDHPELLKGDPLRGMLVAATALGLLTLGAGVSLRAAAPNLAIGPIAVAAGIFYATEGERGVVSTTAVAAVVALAAGVVLAILVVGFHVPGWAASFGGALAVIVWIQRHSDPVTVTGGYQPLKHAYYLVGGFAALSVIGGFLGSIKTVRRAVGRFRPVGDPARRRGGVAAGLTAGALIASCVLATIAGILIAASAETVRVTTGLELSGLAIGIALIAGTSAFGRRGGVFGTVLAVALAILLLAMDDAEGWRFSPFALAAIALGLGLVVTRIVEAMGRPRGANEIDEVDEGWLATSSAASAANWSVPRQDSWSASLPPQPAPEPTGDLWADDRWGTRSDT